MKFTPTQSRFPKDFAGFWKPKEGDVVKGLLVDEFDGEFGKTFLVKLSAPLTVEAKDRDSSKKVEYKAKAGETIGMNEKAGLRGLDKYVRHTITVKYLGKVQSGRTEEHQFDVDVSDKPVKLEESKSASA